MFNEISLNDPVCPIGKIKYNTSENIFFFTYIECKLSQKFSKLISIILLKIKIHVKVGPTLVILCDPKDSYGFAEDNLSSILPQKKSLSYLALTVGSIVTIPSEVLKDL